jgi:endonuclease III
LASVLDALEKHYGVQHPVWPTDPYQFLVWWNCGYPASDVSCTKGWDALKRATGVTPEHLLSADPAVLVRALKSGGIVPEVRAERLKEIANRVLEEFAGDLTAALKSMPLAKARGLLKSFPGIGDPGADRILLFGGLSTDPAVPSNSPQVVVRMQLGRTNESYNRNYKQAHEILSNSIPASPDAHRRAFLLLKCHGERICKRSAPRCDACPVSQSCAWTRAAGTIPVALRSKR